MEFQTGVVVSGPGSAVQRVQPLPRRIRVTHDPARPLVEITGIVLGLSSHGLCSAAIQEHGQALDGDTPLGR